jgi:hypothetical protein
MSDMSILGATTPGYAVICGAALMFMGLMFAGAVLSGAGLVAWVHVND